MEDARERQGAQPFGRCVVQTEFGEVLSLNLFETPDLVCQGYYLPPAYYGDRVRGRFRGRPRLPIPEVELRASRQVIEDLERTSDIRTNREEDSLFFEVYADRFELFGALTLASQRSETSPEVWTGLVNEEMSIVLERYGSPEIVAVVVLIFLLLHGDRRTTELDEECWNRAVEMCGEGNIRSYKVRRSLLGLSAYPGFSHDCEIECK